MAMRGGLRGAFFSLRSSIVEPLGVRVGRNRVLSIVKKVPKLGINKLSPTAHRQKDLGLDVVGVESDAREISAPINIAEKLTINPELQEVMKQIEVDAPHLVKLAVQDYDAAKSAKTTELSITICSDTYIQQLNKQWLGNDSPTDVLSFPQDQPGGQIPLLLLGDVVISAETAARQAEERDHSLLDEMRILLVHGLLHVIGYDHEMSTKAANEMEKQEQHLLTSLGWKGKGLISACGADDEDFLDQKKQNKKQPKQKKKSPFRVLFCDMDGTLLNSKSQVTKTTAEALKAAMSVGVQVIIATGKARPAVMRAFADVGLVGDGGVVSTTSPGVFLQGLLVYGRGGSLVYRGFLPHEYCLKACSYSIQNKIPLIGYHGDCTVATFDDPFVDYLHDFFLEPKAEILGSLDELSKYKIQKLLISQKQEKIERVTKPYLKRVTKGDVTMVQALEDLLEVVPKGACKGDGVIKLLESMGVNADEVMAIGDGENDIEMLEMVGWGVAMANGAAKTLDIADVTVASNDDDGVAEAIQRFILP